MSYEWLPIVDREGRSGRFAAAGSESESVRVVLESGERLRLPRSHLIPGADGTYHSARDFASLREPPQGSLITPLLPAALRRGPLAFVPRPGARPMAFGASSGALTRAD
jgi:hypothetical protein